MQARVVNHPGRSYLSACARYLAPRAAGGPRAPGASASGWTRTFWDQRGPRRVAEDRQSSEMAPRTPGFMAVVEFNDYGLYVVVISNFKCQTFHELSNEWGGRSRAGEARAKPGNQLVYNKNCFHS